MHEAGHLAGLVAVAECCAVGVVLALRAADLGHRSLHQRLHHAQPGADGHGQLDRIESGRVKRSSVGMATQAS